MASTYHDYVFFSDTHLNWTEDAWRNSLTSSIGYWLDATGKLLTQGYDPTYEGQGITDTLTRPTLQFNVGDHVIDPGSGSASTYASTRSSPIMRRLHLNPTIHVNGNWDIWGDSLYADGITANVTNKKKYMPQTGATYVDDDEIMLVFDTGFARFIVLDPWKNTDATTEADFTIGEPAKEKLREILGTYRFPTFVVMHSQAGGLSQPDDDPYARGSGIEAIAFPYEQYELHAMFQRAGVIALFKGHEHQFCHATPGRMHYITCGCTGWVFGPNDAASQTEWGNSYGYSFPPSRPNYVQFFSGCQGFVWLRVATDGTSTLRFVRTMPYLSQRTASTDPVEWAYTDDPKDPALDEEKEAYLGPVVTAGAGGVITVPTNPTTPTARVAGIYAKDNGDAWLLDNGVTLTNLWSGEEGADNIYKPISSAEIAVSGASSGDQFYVNMTPYTIYETQLCPPRVPRATRVYG